jgi:hypothetical protein
VAFAEDQDEVGELGSGSEDESFGEAVPEFRSSWAVARAESVG